MSCNRFELADIFDFSDGSLEAPQRLAFESHVAVCSDCRTALSDIRRIATDLERMPFAIPEPSPRLRESVLVAAEGLLERVREEGTSPARPFRGRPAPTIGADSLRPGVSESRLLRPWRAAPIRRFAVIAAAIVAIVFFLWNFGSDRKVVASILDGDNVLVNGVPYVDGIVDLQPGARIATEAHRAGSFLSASGESVVLGPSSELLVKSRDEENKCLVLSLVRGLAWILIDENRGPPSGVDVEGAEGTHSPVRSGQAFVHVEPDSRIRIELAACGEGDVGEIPRLEMARLDEIVVQLVPDVSSKTAERARSHYDRVKPRPVHWVRDLGHAKTIAWSLRRPILVIDENGALPDEIFEREAGLARAALRYVCVRITRGEPKSEAFLEGVPAADRGHSRLLLCPERMFREGVNADCSIEELVEKMDEECEEITEHWRRQKW